jgi:hypothetical protein
MQNSVKSHSPVVYLAPIWTALSPSGLDRLLAESIHANFSSNASFYPSEKAVIDNEQSCARSCLKYLDVAALISASEEVDESRLLAVVFRGFVVAGYSK